VSLLRLITLAGDPEREALFASQLSTRDDVDLVMRCVDRVELLGAIRGGDLDAVVSVGAPFWLGKQAVQEAAVAGIRLIGVVGDPTTADRLADFGATLVLAEATIDEVLQRCRSSDISLPPATVSSQPSRPMGKLICVWGPKGSPGRTTIALELATVLARTEPATLLIDADSYGGDVIQLLGIVEELPTVVWATALASNGKLDEPSLFRHLRRVSASGPLLLPGLPRAELWADVSEFGWRELLTVARATFAYTVCDVGFCLEPARSAFPGSGEGRNRMARIGLREADRVVAVFRADGVGIKNFLWAFDDVKALVDIDQTFLVANRVRPVQVSEVGEIVKRHIGKRPATYVCDSHREMTRAVMAGRAVGDLFAGSDMASSIEVLAAALGAEVPRHGFLTRLAGRS
jgi:hypothetical protein